MAIYLVSLVILDFMTSYHRVKLKLYKVFFSLFSSSYTAPTQH